MAGASGDGGAALRKPDGARSACAAEIEAGVGAERAYSTEAGAARPHPAGGGRACAGPGGGEPPLGGEGNAFEDDETLARAMLSPVRWREGAVWLLDQRALPREERWLRYEDDRGVAGAIREMVVRGAPAIGCAAAMGVAAAARGLPDAPAKFQEGLERACKRLAESRPTAVNLFWAIDRQRRVAAQALSEGGGVRARAALEAEALAIWREDIAACRAMGQIGAELLPDGAAILTHCNAGALATAGYGTALGVVRAAAAAGKRVRVLADETRPYLQGARLTAWELLRDGIEVTLICDNMAGALMRQGEVTCCVVGADRIAANGDVANKIGTYSLAVLASYHGIPFYVAAPRSTIDRQLASGREIPIEERDPAEVTRIGGEVIAPEGATARYPAFDLSPAELVTAVITEVGLARPPSRETIDALFDQ